MEAGWSGGGGFGGGVAQECDLTQMFPGSDRLWEQLGKGETREEVVVDSPMEDNGRGAGTWMRSIKGGKSV